MGHNGYLVIDDKLFYKADTKGGESDMTQVTQRISNILYHMSLIFQGLETHPFYQTQYPGGHGPQVFYPTDLHRMADWTAKESKLEKIMKDSMPTPKSSEGAIAIKIDTNKKEIILNKYTAQFLPKEIKFNEILAQGYTIRNVDNPIFS